jgi:hypothetical protein
MDGDRFITPRVITSHGDDLFSEKGMFEKDLFSNV